MAISIVQQSPFDSIRKLDAAGIESWSARELMGLLGYSRWFDFADTIDRAKCSCQNAGNQVNENFSGLILKTKGRSKTDFVLSRYACYLVAMNGDPRKPEIALAQSYFVIKAREAELSQKAPAKVINSSYLPARKEALDKLKEHGAKGWVYGSVESYNNALVGIENGKRHEVDELQAYKLSANYESVRRELNKREVGFAKHQVHLKNAATCAMRHGMYAIAGSQSVPETLKPIKERKLLK